MARRRWPLALKAAAVAQYGAGSSPRDIAAALGVPAGKIHRWADRTTGIAEQLRQEALDQECRAATLREIARYNACRRRRAWL